ncbi:class I adenylate-forming enzyme family protein [Undibacter mobilis]|uniref:Cyclohexanecarboxylate-CoA ligase n=1 Tax=Undibacter mobilis TaxID=2292256 RepID=A0A371B3F1_9BRAD|nr:class I adenylate-forming enzyme family protein [Undibacter mobilis]RDV01991.1 cyclohexanecarboxylate-CoA ligase [Undibacter mobilis]
MNNLLTLFNSDRWEEYSQGGFWGNDTLYSLVRGHAQRTPDRIAIRSAGGDLSYRRLVDLVDAFAGDLAETGVSLGQRVAVWLPSRPETIIALLACSRNRYICCPSLHRDHTVGDIVALLKRMRAVAVVAEAGYGADASKNDLFAQLGEVETLRKVYRLEKTDGGRAPGIIAPAGSVAAAPKGNPNTILYLAFTSGTTGEPKGVMHSDNTLLANARALAADWNINETSVVYSLSPLSHNLGFGAMIMALGMGGQIVIHDLPRGASLIDRLIDTGTTFLVGVPTHAIDLLAEVKARNLAGIGRLQGFRISGAQAPQELVAELIARGIIPQSGYGMTETCSHQYTLPNDDPRLIVESCGRSSPGYEIRIFDREDQNRELAAGEIGQIGGRGASLMLGYFDDQKSTEDSFNRDGWFMTGDLGWVDENGYLRITGRKKDVIIRGGHNIYPARIEALAATHDAVQRAAAVPVPDQRLGERVCLAIMTRPGKSVDAPEILQHLDDAGLSKYDMPEFFLRVDEIPLTASGKIRKRDVSDWIADGRVTPEPVRFQAKTQ